VQSIFKQQFGNEIAMNKIHQESYFKQKRYTELPAVASNSDLQASESSVFGRKRSLKSHSDMADYKQFLNSMQPVRKPEYLSKLGGSPSNLEAMLSNQTNSLVYSADPMSKIKGSKASLQWKYYEN
jgi:hypothetical protein